MMPARLRSPGVQPLFPIAVAATAFQANLAPNLASWKIHRVHVRIGGIGEQCIGESIEITWLHVLCSGAYDISGRERSSYRTAIHRATLCIWRSGSEVRTKEDHDAARGMHPAKMDV